MIPQEMGTAQAAGLDPPARAGPDPLRACLWVCALGSFLREDSPLCSAPLAKKSIQIREPNLRLCSSPKPIKMRLALKSLSRTPIAAAARSSVKPNFAAPSGSIAAMATYAENVTELIGNTPMVKLNRVVPNESVAAKVLVKLEMQNPGGSIKDRIALSMIEEAEKRGEISPGKTTIVEATSGNTGIGLAMVAAAKGYKCLIVMPQVPPMYERYIIDRKFGSQVHLT